MKSKSEIFRWRPISLSRPIAKEWCFSPTGAGAALKAAAERVRYVNAVVSRGGRPDLAGDSLARVRSPTLLIVGENDSPVVELNKRALDSIGARTKKLVIVPGATHLFEEPGALDEVARLASRWFGEHFGKES